MVLDPSDYTTWTAFSDHPIFGATKSQITDWSLDPSCYSELDSYGQFMPDHYVHVNPAPPAREQLQVAQRDVGNLASACAQIEQAFGPIKYEMVILDDFTVYVWVHHPRFSVDIYPNNFPDEGGILKLFIDSLDIEASEHDCLTVVELIEALRQALGIK